MPYSESRLIRTEVTTLIGLMIGTPIDFTLPPSTIVSSYVERSEALLNVARDATDSTDASRATIFFMEENREPVTKGNRLQHRVCST